MISLLPTCAICEIPYTVESSPESVVGRNAPNAPSPAPSEAECKDAIAALSRRRTAAQLIILDTACDRASSAVSAASHPPPAQAPVCPENSIPRAPNLAPAPRETTEQLHWLTQDVDLYERFNPGRYPSTVVLVPADTYSS
jgi:hypothetical protein